MNRKDILTGLKPYFKAHELVSPQVYAKYGENSWQFLSTDLLHTLLVVRTELGRPMTINTWFWGGSFSQRGLRDNQSPIFREKFERDRLYLSGHVLGMAIDFDVEGMTASEVRVWLQSNSHKLPVKIRLENKLNGVPINWVHLDVKYVESNPKVYLFDV